MEKILNKEDLTDKQKVAMDIIQILNIYTYKKLRK